MSDALGSVRGNSVAETWRTAFVTALKSKGHECSPLVVTIAPPPGWTHREPSTIRTALDAKLQSNPKLYSTATTAGLVFPSSLWERYRPKGRDFFFEQFRERTGPRLRQADLRNRKGTYFERLVAYGPSRTNQLKDILDAWDSGTSRRSVLQAVVFDPAKDHSRSQYLPFPCLDYVGFAPVSGRGLSMTAFYAMQYLFDRAFGNYVGLCALGTFVAEQLGMPFFQLTCVSGVATLGTLRMKEAEALASEFEGCP